MMSIIVADMLLLCCGILSSHVLVSNSQESCDGVNFVSRDEWGSKYPIPAANITGPVDYVFIHHTAGRECNTEERCSAIVQAIQEFHVKDRGWDDIGYSFLIGGDGRVYVGRGWGKVGAHTYQYNSIAYGISFLGNFVNHVPGKNMIQAAKNIIACGVKQGYIKADYGLYGHRDGRCTECPGDSFYETLATWNKWHAKGPITKYC